MIKFFRVIRKEQLKQNKTFQYLIYAIGEIVLVVIGILIALQINNWNEKEKAHINEVYILNEILKNSEEDIEIVNEIIYKREKAKSSIDSLRKFLINQQMSVDSVQEYLKNLLTFERYYPIKNAYEILKSKGLQLSNNDLTSHISRYYDYEQNKINSSIRDIEIDVLVIYNNHDGLMKNIDDIDKDTYVGVRDINDTNFKKELENFMHTFRNNNAATLEKLLKFKSINTTLILEIKNELKRLN